MRRTGLVLAAVAFALLSAGGAAYAAVVGGTDGDDNLLGTSGRDRMSGGLGDDVMRGLQGRDRMGGGDGEDTVRGGRGDDVISGQLGEDRIYGGRGSDYISSVGDNAVDRVDCGPGVDTVDRSLVAGPDQQDVFENCEKSLG